MGENAHNLKFLLDVHEKWEELTRSIFFIHINYFLISSVHSLSIEKAKYKYRKVPFTIISFILYTLTRNVYLIIDVNYNYDYLVI